MTDVSTGLQVFVIILLGIYCCIILETLCIADRHEGPKFYARVGATVLVLCEFILAILTLLNTNNPSDGLELTMRLLVWVALCCGPPLCIVLVIETTNVFFQSKSRTDAPLWFQRVWTGMILSLILTELVCVTYCLATTKMFGMLIYYHILNFLCIFGVIMLSTQLLLFRRSINPKIRGAAINPQLKKARIKLDILLFFGFVVLAASVASEITILASPNQWQTDSIYDNPYPSLLDYLNHFVFALAFCGAMLWWLFIPVSSIRAIPASSMLNNCALCCLLPCVVSLCCVDEAYKSVAKKSVDSSAPARHVTGPGSNKEHKELKELKADSGDEEDPKPQGADGGMSPTADSASGDFADAVAADAADAAGGAEAQVEVEVETGASAGASDGKGAGGAGATAGTGASGETGDAEKDGKERKRKGSDGRLVSASDKSKMSSKLSKSTGKVMKKKELPEALLRLQYVMNMKMRGRKLVSREVSVDLNGPTESLVGDMIEINLPDNWEELHRQFDNFDESTHGSKAHVDETPNMAPIAPDSAADLELDAKVTDVPLQSLTFDGRVKGKKNKPRVERVNIQTMDRNHVVENRTYNTALAGRRGTFDQSMTMAPELSVGQSMGSKAHRMSHIGGSVSFAPTQPLAHTEAQLETGTERLTLSNTQSNSKPGPGRQSLDNVSVGGLTSPSQSAGVVENITLVLYEFSEVILTNPKKFARVQAVAQMDLFGTDEVALTYGGVSRIDELKTHFEAVLKNNSQAVNQTNKVLCFLLSDFLTSVSFELLKRGDLSQYFVTVEPGRMGSRPRQLSHVIGCNHLLRKENDKEYIVILKLMHVLRRSHENVLYVGHRKDIIDHLAQINACHTHYVKTKGMTLADFEHIQRFYSFGNTVAEE